MKGAVAAAVMLLNGWLIGCGLSGIEFEKDSLLMETNEVVFVRYQEIGTKRFNEQVFFVSKNEDLVEVTADGRLKSTNLTGKTTILIFSSYDADIQDTLEVEVTASPP